MLFTAVAFFYFRLRIPRNDNNIKCFEFFYTCDFTSIVYNLL